MARVLSVTRVRVPAEGQAAWLAAVAALARLEAAAGRHLWLFRHPDDDELFLECSEARSPEQHRAVSPAPGGAGLEAELRRLGRYELSATTRLWDEVPLGDVMPPTEG